MAAPGGAAGAGGVPRGVPFLNLVYRLARVEVLVRNHKPTHASTTLAAMLLLELQCALRDRLGEHLFVLLHVLELGIPAHVEDFQVLQAGE